MSKRKGRSNNGGGKRRQAFVPPFRQGFASRNVRIGGFLDIENKFLDSELTAEAFTASWAAKNPSGTGCTDSISVPAQGNTESSRDGRTYWINSVHVRGHVDVPLAEAQAAPQGGTHVARICLVMDTQTNAAEMTATDVMDAGGTDDTLAFRNLQNSKRFRVLKDKKFVFQFNQGNEGAVNSFYQCAVRKDFEWNHTFKNPIKVTCDAGTTANVSEVTDYNLGLIGVANSTSLTLEYQARVRFSG